VNYDTSYDTMCQGDFTSATLLQDGVCTQTDSTSSEKFTCTGITANGTTGAQFQQFSSTNCAAGTKFYDVIQIAAPFDASAKPTNCWNSQVFTCSFQFNSATTTVVSMVSMIVAAFVALVASKQL